MSDSQTNRMLSVYRQITTVPGFLSGFFTSPPRNFHDSEAVEIDILREDEDVAVAVQNITSGARSNQATVLTNKQFVPPVFKEEGPISAFELNKRQAGQDPFQDPDFQGNAMAASTDLARRLSQKISRSVELMASQALQTGTITLTDDNGDNMFTMDFKPKTAHNFTAGTWAAGAGDPLADLQTLANLIRKNGRVRAVRAIMGEAAFDGFLKNATVLARLDNRRLELGGIGEPQTRGFGGTFHGTVSTGNFNLEIWTYDQDYKHPVSGVLTPFLATDKVIVMGDARLDLTFGNIPLIGPVEAQALQFLPRRVSDGERGTDLIQNSWITKNRESLMISVGARPLTIPTAIDSFGCIDAIT